MQFWSRWLVVVSIFGVVIGTAMFLLPLAEVTIGPLYYEVYAGEGAYDSLSRADLDFQRFLYGVAGAVLAAWLMMVGDLAAIPLRRGERWAWNAIAAGLILWFGGDGYASIIAGFPVHAVLNLSLLMLIGIPLAATRDKLSTV